MRKCCKLTIIIQGITKTVRKEKQKEMHSKKKMLPILFVLFLLLFSLTSPAVACVSREAGDVCYQKSPLKIHYQEDCYKGEFKPIVYRFGFPLENGETKKYCCFTRFIINKQYPVPGWSPKLKPVPRPEPKPEPRPEQKPDPGLEPEPGQEPGPGLEPGPGTEPVPVPEPDPGQEPGQGQEPEPSSILSADEAEMLQSVNEERRGAGLQPLQIHEGLVNLARLKSEDMIKMGYFSHQSPTYGSPFEMITGAGITYFTAGENIAGAPTVARAHQSLMNSPGHRANILHESFTHVGIGIVDGGPYGKMFTQIFIGQR